MCDVYIQNAIKSKDYIDDESKGNLNIKTIMDCIKSYDCDRFESLMQEGVQPNLEDFKFALKYFISVNMNGTNSDFDDQNALENILYMIYYMSKHENLKNIPNINFVLKIGKNTDWYTHWSAEYKKFLLLLEENRTCDFKFFTDEELDGFDDDNLFRELKTFVSN